MPKVDLPKMSFAQHDTPMSPLRLVIRGSSVMEGRSASLMRIRPSLLKRLRAVAIGPTYLIIDVLLQAALAELEKPGKQHDIAAEDLDPTPEDFALLEEEMRPKARPGGRNSKAKASEDEPAVALPAGRRARGPVSSKSSVRGDAAASEVAGDSVSSKPKRKADGAPVSSRRKAPGAAPTKSGGKKH